MQSILNKIQPWLWAGVWFSLPVSLKMNSIFLILFSTATLLNLAYYRPKFSRQQIILSSLFFLFFLANASSLLFGPDTVEVKNNLERKLSYIAIPIVIMLLDHSKWDVEKWAIRGFFAGLMVTGTHMLFLALLNILSGIDWHLYTYHEFTKPYSIGAIYYSLYLSTAIFYLLFKNPEPIITKYRLFLFSFFLLLLLLCASKLFIGFMLPIILWQYFKKLKTKKSLVTYLITALVLIGLFAASIPFLNRLAELKNTNLKVVSQKEFAYDTPFNGLNFRLLQWRLGIEILNENNAWLLGIGIGEKQNLLNEKYKEYNIYTGNPDLGDSGYLNYNFHNQYLETLVGSGIIGLLLLFFIIFYIFVRHRKKLFFPFVVYFLILLFFIFESVLERQVGIVFFCLTWMLSTNSATTTYGSNTIAGTK
ncbi:MAG TPA: O-antigen ligase family protein [Bacteroidales bacterium]